MFVTIIKVTETRKLYSTYNKTNFLLEVTRPKCLSFITKSYFRIVKVVVGFRKLVKFYNLFVVTLVQHTCIRRKSYSGPSDERVDNNNFYSWECLTLSLGLFLFVCTVQAV